MATDRNMGASALLAAILPALVVAAYWAVAESRQHTLLVLVVALAFCFGYTLFIVLPLFWVLKRFIVLGPRMCVAAGALLTATPPFLMNLSRDLGPALLSGALFVVPGMLAGCVFYLLQRESPDPSLQGTRDKAARS